MHFKDSICPGCVDGIIALLKQQPEQPGRIPIHMAISTYENEHGNVMTIVVTTCNDGTRWKEDAGSGFMKMPSIPQEDEK
jgi:hypothetical protein